MVQALVMPERESPCPAVGRLEVPALSLPVAGAPTHHRNAPSPDTVQDGQSTWSGLSTLTSSEFSRPQVVEVGVQYELSDLSAQTETHGVELREVSPIMTRACWLCHMDVRV